MVLFKCIFNNNNSNKNKLELIRLFLSMHTHLWCLKTRIKRFWNSLILTGALTWYCLIDDQWNRSTEQHWPANLALCCTHTYIYTETMDNSKRWFRDYTSKRKANSLQCWSTSSLDSFGDRFWWARDALSKTIFLR